jgi:transcriptional regulator with XRE-family HTH domain
MKKDEKNESILAKLFAANLLRRREKMELSQAQLATRAGYTPGMISALERGERQPSFASIEHISRALGCQHPREMFRG